MELLFRKKKSFYNNVRNAYSLIIFLILLFITSSSYYVIHKFFTESMVSNMLPAANILSNSAKNALLFNEEFEITNLKSFAKDFLNIKYFELLNKNKKPLSSHNPDMYNQKLVNQIVFNKLIPNKNDDAGNTWHILLPVYSNESSHYNWTANQNVSNKDTRNIIGYVYLIFDTEKERKSINLFLVIFVILMSILFLVCFIGLNRIAKKYVHPIDSLITANDKYREDYTIQELKITGVPEIDQVFTSYTKMLQETELNRQNSIKKKVELKELVNERTKELSKALESVKRSEKAKIEFIAKISHEIRTPIQNIFGFCSCIESELHMAGDFSKDKDFAKIKENISSFDHLISQVLDFSKVKEAKTIINPKKMTMEDFKVSISSAIEMLVKKNKLSFTIEEDTFYRPINIDHHKYAQIAKNLVSNAEKFTVDGEINIHVKLDNNDLILDIKDTGIGIPEDKHELIFEQFQQVDSNDTRSYDGTGIGLAISKQLAELMKGMLIINPEYKDGASFTLSVPC